MYRTKRRTVKNLLYVADDTPGKERMASHAPRKESAMTPRGLTYVSVHLIHRSIDYLLSPIRNLVIGNLPEVMHEAVVQGADRVCRGTCCSCKAVR